MDATITHKNYVPFGLNKFQKTDKFIDCILEIENGDPIRTHRVLLAKYSKWFYQYFKDHPIKINEVLTIKLPSNPENVVPDIIDFFYTGHLHLTVSNITSFMHCANLYGISIVEEITSNTFIEMINEKNALFFARRLIESNLTSKYEFLAPIISKQVMNIINGKQSLISKQDIFKSLNPMLFHQVLMEDPLSSLNDFVKAKLIDDFVGDTTISEDDKQFLASVIEWGMPESNGPGKDAYKILVNFKCNWVPSNISRSLYIYVINVRRNNLNALENEISKSKPESNKEYSRWFLYPWIDSIKYSKTCDSNPKIDIIDFISRFGFRNSKIDSISYGLFSVNSSKPVSSMFESKYAFLNQGYFLTQTPDKQMPFLSIYFGPNAHVLADQIKIRCHPIADDDIDLKKTKKSMERKLNFNHRPPPLPFSVIAQSPFTEQETLASSVVYDEMEKDGDFNKIEIKSINPFENLTIVQDTNSPYGNNVFRMYQFELHGQFLP